MSFVLYVVNVIDVDLVVPSKIYEGMGPHFESLYDAALEAVLKVRKDIPGEELKEHFQKNEETMKKVGGFIHAYDDNEIEIYSAIYQVSTSTCAVSTDTKSKRRRVDTSPPSSPTQSGD